MVEKYITQLLYKHPRVTIPEVGSFEAYEAPAEWTPGEQSISPTTRKLRFNDEIKEDDSKLLVQAVAEGQNVSTDEAAQQVGIYSLDIREALKEENEYVFDELGTIYINIEHKLELLPNPDTNFEGDSFGLPTVSTDPDATPEPEPETATSDDNFFDSVDTQADDNTGNEPEQQNTEKGFPYTAEPASTEETQDETPEENHAFVVATPDDTDSNDDNDIEEPQPVADPELTVEQIPVVEADTVEEADEAVAAAVASPKLSETGKKKMKESREKLVVVKKKSGMPVWAWLLLIPILLLVLFGILITVLPEETRMAYFPFLGKEPTEQHIIEREGVVVTGTDVDGTVINGEGEAINIADAGSDNYTSTTDDNTDNYSANSGSSNNSSNYSGSTGFASSGQYITPNSPKKYYVVVGSFSDATNARQLEGELKRKGLETRVTMSSGQKNTYRVVVGEHSSLANAEEAMKNLPAKINNDNLWVLKY